MADETPPPMRLLGLLGGMSFESTLLYYRLINEGVRRERGGLSSAPLLLHSCDFAPVASAQARGDWPGLARDLGAAAATLAGAGAQGLMICSNTMHRLFAETEKAFGGPLIHVADETGAAIRARGLNRPLLLGTRFTMEGGFYADRLAERFGIEALTPDEAGRTAINAVIYDELCQGVVSDAARSVGQDLIASGREAGADCVILGCTELVLLIDPLSAPLPVFDTTALHAEAGVRFILGG
jgi:aspartate racemase